MVRHASSCHFQNRKISFFVLEHCSSYSQAFVLVFQQTRSLSKEQIWSFKSSPITDMKRFSKSTQLSDLKFFPSQVKSSQGPKNFFPSQVKSSQGPKIFSSRKNSNQLCDTSSKLSSTWLDLTWTWDIFDLTCPALVQRLSITQSRLCPHWWPPLCISSLPLLSRNRNFL